MEEVLGGLVALVASMHLEKPQMWLEREAEAEAEGVAVHFTETLEEQVEAEEEQLVVQEGLVIQAVMQIQRLLIVYRLLQAVLILFRWGLQEDK